MHMQLHVQYFILTPSLPQDGYTRPTQLREICYWTGIPVLHLSPFFSRVSSSILLQTSANRILQYNSFWKTPDLRVLRHGKSFLEAFLVADPALNSTEMAQKISFVSHISEFLVQHKNKQEILFCSICVCAVTNNNNN